MTIALKAKQVEGIKHANDLVVDYLNTSDNVRILS